MDSSSLVAQAPPTGLRPIRAFVPQDRGWRRNRFGMWSAIAIAMLLHVAVLLLVLHSSQVSFALQGAGRPVTGTSVEVTLVSSQPPAQAQPPAPVTPHPQPKPVTHTPTPHRSTPVLASRTSSSTETVKVADPAPPTPPSQPTPSTSVPNEQQATPAAAQTAPAAINPQMNLPGSQAVKNVKNIACRIPQPVYPTRARRLQQQGNVLLRVTISTSGHISEAKVTTSSGIPDLDASAVDAMLAGNCQPYIEDGQAISVTALQTVAFQLNP